VKCLARQAAQVGQLLWHFIRLACQALVHKLHIGDYRCQELSRAVVQVARQAAVDLFFHSDQPVALAL